MKKKGIDVTKIRLDVKMYNHVAIYNKYYYVKTKKELSDEEIIELGNEKINEMIDEDIIYVEEISFDMKMYINADIKNIINQRFMRIIKQCAIDCQLNLERNQLPTDIDYSKECDYDICKYKCYGVDELPKNEEIEDKNYDILYSEEIINSCVLELINNIKKYGYITYDFIEKKYIKTGIYKNIFVYLAIDRLLTEYNKINDNFGFEREIKINGSTFYIDRNYNSFNSIEHTLFENIKSENIDSNVLYLDKIKEFPLMELDENNNFVENEYNLNIYNNLLFYLNKLDKTFLINFIEECLINLIKIKNIKKLILEYVIYRIYERFIFHMEEPIEDIKKVEEYYNIKKHKQGRRASEFSTLKIKNKIVFDFKNVSKKTFNSEIYLHCLNIFKDQKIFTIMNLNFNLRIIKINENNFKWRDTNKFETDVYKYIIQQEIFENFNVLKNNNNLIGISINNNFYLLKTDNVKNTGQKCISILISTLIEYIVFNNDLIKKYFPSNYDTLTPLSDIKDYLIYQKYPNVSSLSNNMIYFIYFLYKNYKRDELCEILQKFLNDSEKTFVLNF